MDGGGVALEPGFPPVVGKQAIQANNEKERAQYPSFKVLNYVPTFKEIQIADGWAYGWGETDAKFAMSPERTSPFAHQGSPSARAAERWLLENGTHHLESVKTADAASFQEE